MLQWTGRRDPVWPTGRTRARFPLWSPAPTTPPQGSDLHGLCRTLSTWLSWPVRFWGMTSCQAGQRLDNLRRPAQTRSAQPVREPSLQLCPASSGCGRLSESVPADTHACWAFGRGIFRVARCPSSVDWNAEPPLAGVCWPQTWHAIGADGRAGQRRHGLPQAETAEDRQRSRWPLAPTLARASAPAPRTTPIPDEPRTLRPARKTRADQRPSRVSASSQIGTCSAGSA